MLIKARQALGIIWRLGGLNQGMSGMAVRCMYLACVRTNFEYGIEVWKKAANATCLGKISIIQNSGLRQILGAVKTTPICVMEVETAIPPVEERFRFLTATKAIRLRYGISSTNPLRQIIDTRDNKSPIRDIMYTLTNENQDSNEQLLPYIGPAPWDSRRKNDEHSDWYSLWKKKQTEKKIEMKSLLTEWQQQYEANTKGKWYRSIVKNAKCAIRVPPRRTISILRREPRRVLSKITMFRTGHGSIGAWRSRFLQTQSMCECGSEIEDIRHILTACPLYNEQREFLRGVSPELDLPTLLNTRKGLQAVASFLKHQE